MFNYEDKYYSELSDLVLDLDLANFKKGDTIEVEDCTLEPIDKLSSELLTDLLIEHWEDRLSEDGNEYDKIENILADNIDYELINSLLPKLWYPNGKEIIFTYNDIMEEANRQNN